MIEIRITQDIIHMLFADKSKIPKIAVVNGVAPTATLVDVELLFEPGCGAVVRFIFDNNVSEIITKTVEWHC